MILKKLTTKILLAALIIFPAFIQAKEIVYIDITSAETRKINFAVPWFQNRQARTAINEFGKEFM